VSFFLLETNMATSLPRQGRKRLRVETQDWEQTAASIGRFFEVKAEDLS
jgi:hypothetical protein